MVRYLPLTNQKLVVVWWRWWSGGEQAYINYDGHSFVSVPVQMVVTVVQMVVMVVQMVTTVVQMVAMLVQMVTTVVQVVALVCSEIKHMIRCRLHRQIMIKCYVLKTSPLCIALLCTALLCTALLCIALPQKELYFEPHLTLNRALP